MFFWHLPGMLLLVFQGMTLDSWKDYQICRIASGEIENSMYLSEKKYVACYLPSFSKIGIAGTDALARTTRSWASSDSLVQINMKHSRFSWVVFSWDSSDTRTWQHLDILWTQERDRSHHSFNECQGLTLSTNILSMRQSKIHQTSTEKGNKSSQLPPLLLFFFFKYFVYTPADVWSSGKTKFMFDCLLRQLKCFLMRSSKNIFDPVGSKTPFTNHVVEGFILQYICRSPWFNFSLHVPLWAFQNSTGLWSSEGASSICPHHLGWLIIIIL